MRGILRTCLSKLWGSLLWLYEEPNMRLAFLGALVTEPGMLEEWMYHPVCTETCCMVVVVLILGRSGAVRRASAGLIDPCDHIPKLDSVVLQLFPVIASEIPHLDAKFDDLIWCEV